MKLTKPQTDALRRYSGDKSAPPPATRRAMEQTNRALIDRGLINPVGWTLTAAGREALRQAETIEINGKTYRRFIPYPGPVRDGTVRCLECGQIDESPWHDDELCRQAFEDRLARARAAAEVVA